MKRSVSITSASVLALSLLLAGCSGQGGQAAKPADNGSNAANKPADSPAPKASPDGKPVTLRFATWDTGDALKIEQDIAKKFEESHPNTKIQVEAYGDGFDQKLAAAIGANDAPDVMYMWDFPTYHSNLETLDDYINSDPDLKKDDFYPGLFNYVKIDGKSYGLPAGFTTRVMYYNKKLFDAAGVAYPKEGWSWDDLRDMAKKLTDPSKKQYGIGIRAENDPYDLQGMIWSNGGSFISPDGKSIEGFMNGKGTVDAIQLLGSLIKEKVAVVVGGKNQQSGDDVFKAGKIAMWESGIWPLDDFKKSGIDVGTVVMPIFSGKPLKGVVSESAMSISKNSKNKKEAWEFVKFYASDAAIKMRTADLPVRKSVADQMKLNQDPLYQPFYKMLDTCDNTPAFLLNPKWNEVNRNLNSAIDAVISGQNAADTLSMAVKDSQKFLK
ncbi:sugar ABC transporter substrate-binding protein [Gordoniibacillus kamchatkensis]|uniref:Sugar ABC transporter substrate-binding protein n=1 Tax=Gordoniibacillus kamchatkensis TaxID=1590651 RepID=A0ABR5AMK4_9BACL|nr:sugar ABC transporter substrate-binding protein [Paenibacillus sp. VKM B-2647]KIL42244.1 sugar ABC transporter substrate-binding protein [Paenibacillus sp. VKM B-2647]